nr:MAG TPA: hypothetical protein [Caudoviricetes sp.]
MQVFPAYSIANIHMIVNIQKLFTQKQSVFCKFFLYRVGY